MCRTGVNQSSVRCTIAMGAELLSIHGMKILFIGGTGNISAASVRLAVASGYRVSLLNRGNRKLEDYGIEGAESLVADINDEAGMLTLLKERHFDVVANFIAFTPDQVERDVRLFNGKCGQYIYISSASAYQKPPANPFITESTPLKNPFWQYSRDKIACELACEQAYRDLDFPITIVRPSLTYETVIPLSIGAWEDFTIVDRIRKGKPVIVQGDGTSLWTITHSRDFAVGFVGLFGNQRALGEAFHITSDEVLSWNQLYDAVGEAVGVGPVDKVHIASDLITRLIPDMVGTLIGDKSHSAIFDNSKIKQVVPEFNATIPFKQGIAGTIKWFDAHPDKSRVREETNAMLDRAIETYLDAFGDREVL